MSGIACAWSWIATNHDAIQTVLLVFATIAAFGVMWHNAIISRREATIQMVDKQFGDERQHYEDYKTLFLDIEETGQDLVDFASEDANNKKARDILLRQLNRYELIALAVSKGVFSERFYKRWFYTQLTRDFDRLLPLIKAMRQHFTNEAIFCEFESLAQRWERKKHPVKHPPTWKILWWIATGRRSKASLALRSPKRPPAANNLPKPGSGG